MWRWISLALVIVLLSGAATVAVQLWPTADSQVPVGIPAASDEPTGPLPLAVIDSGGELTHKFGNMAQEDIGTHEWVVKNVGEGDLKLSQGEHTCSCTIASLKDGETGVVKPGGTTKVKIRWETRLNTDAFEKSSTINTNDPEHPKIRFAVSGKVHPAIMRFPAGDVFDLGNVPNDRDYQTRVALFSPDRPDFKVTKVRTRDGSFLSVTLRPLKPDELKGAPVDRGLALDVTLKPGTYLGSFREEIAVETDHTLKPELKIPVAGRVVGPISSSPEALQLHHVSSSRGGTGVLILNVRDRDEPTQFQVDSVPKGLKVAIRQSDVKKGAVVGASRQYLLTATVVPGTPPGEILGSISLKTDHPKAAVVKIPVDVLVLSSE